MHVLYRYTRAHTHTSGDKLHNLSRDKYKMTQYLEYGSNLLQGSNI